MTKLEQLLEWMDDAEYAPSYGELREKVKELIDEEQQVKSVDLDDVVGQSEQLFCHHEGKYTLKSDGNCCKCHLPPNPNAK